MLLRRPVLAAGAVVVALTTAVTAAALAPQPRVRAEFRVPSRLTTADAPGVTAEAPPPSRPATVATQPPPAPVTVRYAFDGGIAGAIPDSGGVLPLSPKLAAGGALEALPRAGRGLAVRFPAPCPRHGAQNCRRGILQSGPADFLNPGRSPFRYGATIRLSPNETSPGANVLQKGYAFGNSQFKLQVDGAAGQPSCVLVGLGAKRVYLASSPATVADGQWHEIQCARRDDLLTVTVDGAIRGRTNIPAALSIVNSDPLCIGGKGIGPNNDQFNGAVDDAYVTLER